jgi:hypothetical protein
MAPTEGTEAHKQELKICPLKSLNCFNFICISDSNSTLQLVVSLLA